MSIGINITKANYWMCNHAELAKKASYIVTFTNLPKPEDAGKYVYTIHLLNPLLHIYAVMKPIVRETIG